MNKDELALIQNTYEAKLDKKINKEKVKEFLGLIKDFSFADVNNAIMILSERQNFNWNNFAEIVNVAKKSEEEQKRFQSQKERIEAVNKRLEEISNEPSMKELHEEDKLDAVEDLKYSKVSLKLLRPIINEKGEKDFSPLMKMLKMRYTRESIGRLIAEVKSGEHDRNLEKYEKMWQPTRENHLVFDIENAGFFVNMAKELLKKGLVICFQKAPLSNKLTYFPVTISYANISLRDKEHFRQSYIGDAKRYGHAYPVLVNYL